MDSSVSGRLARRANTGTNMSEERAWQSQGMRPRSNLVAGRASEHSLALPRSVLAHFFISNLCAEQQRSVERPCEYDCVGARVLSPVC